MEAFTKRRRVLQIASWACALREAADDSCSEELCKGFLQHLKLIVGSIGRFWGLIDS